jgi:hypothetical protein
MKKIITAGILSVSLLSGCASIVEGSFQRVAVQTTASNEPVPNVACKLENTKGNWALKTPGSITVRRASDDLYIQCVKDGVPAPITAVKSSGSPWLWGNLLFGGLIGLGVDLADGDGYAYPLVITADLVAPPDGKLPDGSGTIVPPGTALRAAAAPTQLK